MSRLSLSVATWLFLCLSILFLRFERLPERVISWDVFGYYLYLPASFIHHDLAMEDQEWVESLMEEYQPSATFYQATRQENGRWVIKYPMGMALSYSPFFLLAHKLSPALGYPADGMSLPYAILLSIGALLYAFTGLWFLRKVLLRYFSEKMSALLLVLIVLGTNYLQLTAFDGTLLSHTFLFSLYAMLFWFTIRWHESATYLRAIAVGLILGLLTLVRPSEAIVFLFPLIYGMGSAEGRREKLALIRENPGHVVALAVAAILMGLPQLFYWKYTSGQWLFYSYINPGEGFEFLKPYSIPFLFGFRKGWFIYTPIMFLAILGLLRLRKEVPALLPALLIFLVIDIWIVSSWTCWWYAGGSFSSRSMLPAYVLLAIPLGMFLKWAFKSRAGTVATGALLIFLVSLNLFQTWQFTEGIISKERMTRDYYFRVFGKIATEPEDEKLLLVERGVETFARMHSEKGYTRSVLYMNSFDEDPEAITLSSDSNEVLALHGARIFSPGPDLSYDKITSADHAWLRISVRLMIPESYHDALPVLVATFHHKDKPYMYNALPPDSLLKGQWQTHSFDYLTPEVRSVQDNFKAYVWQQGQDTLFIDDLRVDIFQADTPNSSKR